MTIVFDKDQPAAIAGETSRDLIDAENGDRLILLVEDNETNRLVMSMQISTLGYSAMIASDGKEALELCRNHSFALILTDCSMPEIDGYELASVIRQAEKNTGTHTPIVAVTANVGDREIIRCRECGMDECIFKPVDMGALQSVIERWLSKTGSSKMCAGNGGKQAEVHVFEDGETCLPVDSAVLRRLVGDDSEMHHRMLLKYRNTSPHVFNSMMKAVKERDFTSVVILAHKFKSSSRTIGAGQLADLVQSIEDAAEINENEEVNKLASLITDEFDKVVQYINRSSQGVT